jgi:hypothetical protein
VWRVRWSEQLQARSLPALLLSHQHLQQHLRPAWAWRPRREPRTRPALIRKPRPLAAKARRPARAAGRGGACLHCRGWSGQCRTRCRFLGSSGDGRRRFLACSGDGGCGCRWRGGDRSHPGRRHRPGCRFCRENACGRLACCRPGVTAFDARQAPPDIPRQSCHRYFFRASSALISWGTTLKTSPTTPKSAISKIGASESLLMATIVFAVCMPARC